MARRPRNGGCARKTRMAVRDCIGIISLDYRKKGEARFFRFKDLLVDLQKVFPEADFVIIAQNYKPQRLKILKSLTPPRRTYIYEFEKGLGITGARRELQKRILELKYDYAILLDDDAVIRPDPVKGKAFLQRLHRADALYSLEHVLHLAGLSRRVLLECEMPDIESVRGDGYEDVCYYYLLRNKYWKTFVERDYGLLEHDGGGFCSTWIDQGPGDKKLSYKTALWLAERGLKVKNTESERKFTLEYYKESKEKTE